MPALFLYILKFSIALACFYIFYQLVLRRLTFYQWNRFYLALYPLVCFIIPFVDISAWVNRPELIQTPLTAIPSVTTFVSTGSPIPVSPSAASLADTWQIIFGIFITGILVMLSRLVKQYVSLLRIRHASKATCYRRVWLYDVQQEINPFSFGNDIYINRSQHTADELEKIIQHEFVHVKQQHTIDLMIGELICIYNWFNPFAWLIRRAIRQNLEFIADSGVLATGADAKEYQYLLLKVVGLPQYSITNHFSFSSLKKRIAMMNKIRSAKLHLARFLFLLPLCALILLAFRNKEIESAKKDQPGKTVRMEGKGQVEEGVDGTSGGIAIVKHNNVIMYFTLPSGQLKKSGDTVPAQAVPGETLNEIIRLLPELQLDNSGRMTIKGEAVKKIIVDGKEYFINTETFGRPQMLADTNPVAPVPPVVRTLPATVKSIRIHDTKATVVYKNGKQEKYNLALEREKAAFDEKFGGYAPPAPPVPPSPATTEPVPALAATPIESLPPAAMPSGVEVMEVNGNKITIRLKDGTVETYDLHNSDQKATYYKKYGSSPKPPKEVALPAVPALPVSPEPPAPPASTNKNETNVIEHISPGVYTLRNAALDEFLAAARKRGEMFIGIDNPLDIKIDDVRNEDMVIKMDNGNVILVNGVFYARPTRQGMSNLVIFRREKDGSKTPVKTVPVEVKRLPDPTLLQKENKKPVSNSMYLWHFRYPWMPAKDNC